MNKDRSQHLVKNDGDVKEVRDVVIVQIDPMISHSELNNGDSRGNT